MRTRVLTMFVAAQVVLFQDAHVLDPSRDDVAVFVISHALSNLAAIESVNTAALTMFGYNKRDMVGKNVSLIVPPPMNARHDLYLKAFLDSGRSVVSGPATHESTGLTTSAHTHV